jgi:exopolysaccharide biosynthesis polyprenyl glycosylphosphotransferase
MASASTRVLENTKRSRSSRSSAPPADRDETLQRALLEASNGARCAYRTSRRIAKKYIWASPRGPLQRVFFVAMDLLLTLGFVLTGLSISRAVVGTWAVTDRHIESGVAIIYTSLLLLACECFGLYSVRQKSRPSQMVRVTAAGVLATWSTGIFGYVSGLAHSGCVAVAAIAPLNLLALGVWRIVAFHLMERKAADGHGNRVALILGAGATGRRLEQYLTSNPHARYTILGLLDDNRTGPGILGHTVQFRSLAQTKFIETLFVTLPLDSETISELLRDACPHGVNVKLVLDLPPATGNRERRDTLDENFAVVNIYDDPLQEIKLGVKRFIDILGAVLGLLMLSPLLALIALVIKLDSPGPVVYRSFRIGKKGKKFPFYKFRTMVANAEEIKEQLRGRNEREGLLFKIADDPRITKVGRLLRKYSLDELLQLWNVLRGDMSLVGPRPASLDEFHRYRLQHLLRVSVTPGLTGLWQVTARKDPSFERYLSLDRDYIRNWSLRLDLEILLKTAPAVLRGEGQ